MNTTTLSHQQKTERLTDAFRVFNELSENLAESYQGLQQQIASLNKALDTARSERMVSLIEKEKLANRLQQILAALPAAVVVVGAKGLVVDCNQYAVDYLGEPLLGQPWQTVMKRSLQAAGDSPQERQLADGRRVTLISNALSNQSEQIILLFDISELRALQEALAQQKQLSAMGEMVASLAHQVRTPLSTAILYASHLAKPQLADEKRQQYAGKIMERLQYLERQVNDMLVFAKQGRLSMQRGSLKRLVNRSVESVERFSGQIYVEISGQHDAIYGNEDALRGALINLLNNAIEAGATRIYLNAFGEASGARIVVDDNGCGIASDQLQQIFEPFHTSKLNGTGLGLAVVASVIKAHHGHIDCLSQVGQGSVFSLTLPAHPINQLNLSQSRVEVNTHEIV